MLRWQKWGVLTLLVVGLVIGLGHQGATPPGLAQAFIVPREAASQIYSRLPEIPLENQYLRQDNGAVATESTLVERFIQYHTSVKGRSPVFRLDWQLTFADYLGLNDYLKPEFYPGRNYLRANPMAADIAAIQALTRPQRQALLNALSTLYGDREITVIPREQTTTAAPEPQPTGPQLRPISRPGEADLLAPPPQPRPMPTGDARFLLP